MGRTVDIGVHVVPVECNGLPGHTDIVTFCMLGRSNDIMSRGTQKQNRQEEMECHTYTERQKVQSKTAFSMHPISRNTRTIIDG
jgi:hypothetical protein